MSNIATAQALRDFFFSRHGPEMGAAVARLKQETVQAPNTRDWEQVEFDFNRLFVGPMALAAPPYASVYLDPEPLLMGRSTLKVREVYHFLGLASPAENSLPDDHIALELDACVVMCSTLTKTHNTELGALWNAFLQEHLQQWIPQFVDRIKHTPEVHPIFCYVADRLQTWRDTEVAALPPVTAEQSSYQEGEEYDTVQ